MTHALIPVKDLSQAKERLSPVLDAAGRRTLALAMFRDVLAAAFACDAIDGVAVVSRDPEILDEARAAGAEPMPEPGGLNEALASAARILAAWSTGRMLILAADVPTATPAVMARVLAAEADVVIVPSQDGGTNAMAILVGAIPFLYGESSARRHLTAARDADLTSASLDLPELALDIDTPADLERLAATLPRERVASHTTEAMRDLGLLRATAEL